MNCEIRRFDCQTFSVLHTRFEFSFVVDPEPGGKLIQICQRNILQNGLNENQSMSFSILWDEANAMVHCLPRIFDRQLMAFQFYVALSDPAVLAKDRHDEFSASRIHQPCTANNLTLAEVERYSLEHLPILSWSHGVQVFDFKDHLAGMTISLGEAFFHLPPNHVADEFFPIQALGRLRCNDLAITHDRNRIRDAEKLFDLMRNIDTSHAMLF